MLGKRKDRQFQEIDEYRDLLHPPDRYEEAFNIKTILFYFWKKYGRQQWRLYAAVLSVGFAVGMPLVGMASVALAMIQKSLSVLIF